MAKFLTAMLMASLAVTASARQACRVKNTADSGIGSLRDCLEQANLSAPGGEFLITFKRSLKDQVITITGDDLPQVTVPGKLTVIGLKGNTPIIDGREDDILPFIFYTGAGVDLDISKLTVVGGFECIRMTGSGANDVALRLFSFYCSDTTASGVFVDTNFRDISIVKSSFTNCGNDGINAIGATSSFAGYTFNLKGVKASFNAGYGVNLVGRSGTVGGVVNVGGCKFNNNGGYGMEINDLDAGLIVPLIELSEFNNNNEGLEIINGRVQVIRLCTFNSNTEYGLGLEQTTVDLIQACEILNNGTYGIDLEAESIIVAIEKTTIKGSGIGIIRCGAAKPPSRSAATHTEPTRE